MSVTGLDRARVASRAAVARIRRATHAEGAGASGLASLIELHGVHSAGDAIVAVALANTLFFGVPVGEARGRVALYLLLTLAPFALIAPVVGPLLDRVHGRRYALAGTMVGRAALAWIMAGALADHNPFALYPAAFAILVVSKAYGVSRSAVVPRLLPHGTGLVKANARVSLAGLLTGIVAAPIAVAVTVLTASRWSLRLAAVVFVVGTVLALRLPAKVDSAAGERPLGRRADLRDPFADSPVDEAGRTTRPWWVDGPAGAAPPPALEERERLPVLQRLRTVGPAVALALRSAGALRAYSGFLTLFLAFLLRSEHFAGVPEKAALALFVVAAAGGGLGGTALGARLPPSAPERITTVVVATAAVTSLLGAAVFGLVAVLVTALVAGIAQALSKLALDATIQRDIPEGVRTSAFARSETVLQLAWVLGGAIGLIPMPAQLGLGLAGAGLVVVLLDDLRRLRSRRRGAHGGQEPPR